MIISFSTRFDRLTMFGEPALALLGLLGHSGSVPGAILAAELPAAVARLRTGLEQAGKLPSPAPAPAQVRSSAEDSQPPERPVELGTRAVPLLAMIERAIAGGSDLMWERG